MKSVKDAFMGWSGEASEQGVLRTWLGRTCRGPWLEE